jgi:hypothetical protein
MDAASQHISDDVLLRASRLQVILSLIPAQLTWPLQPLDVEVFREFKDALRQKQMEIKIDSGVQSLNPRQRITALRDTILNILVHRDWSHAFARVGLARNPEHMKANIAGYVGNWDDIPPLPLSQEALVDIIGRDRSNWHQRFFNAPLVHIARREHMAVALSDAAANEVGAMEAQPRIIALPPNPLPPMPPPASGPSEHGGSVSSARSSNIRRTRSGTAFGSH